MSHSCGRYTVEALLSRCEPRVRLLYRKLLRMVRRCGPVHVIPQKTRLAFQVRVRFAGFSPRKSSLRLALWFTKPSPGPRVERIEKITPRCYVHYFRIASEADLDAELQDWLHRAYRVGRQEHLESDDL
jgi:hypothetical protein